MLLSGPVSNVQEFSVWSAHKASKSPGTLLEMDIFRPHLTPAESDTLGVQPGNFGFNKPSRGFRCPHTFENHCPIVSVSA